MSLIAPPDSNRTARTESPLVPSLTKRFALSLACVRVGLARPRATATAKYPKYLRAWARGISLAGTESMWARMRRTPFSLWVIAGALTYSALALVALALPVVLAGGITAGGGLLLFLFLFVALFLV